MAVDAPNKYSPEIESTIRLFYSTLSEKERRRYVAVEAVKIGYGGQVDAKHGHEAGLEHNGPCYQEVVFDQTQGHRSVSRRPANWVWFHPPEMELHRHRRAWQMMAEMK
jgi:hypothetical protein